MKTVSEYMKNIPNGYDVAVQDEEGLWEHGFGGWHNYNDGWFNEEDTFANSLVVKVEIWKEEKMMVLIIAE